MTAKNRTVTLSRAVGKKSDYVSTIFSGIFSYLDNVSGINQRAEADSIGIFAAARSNSGSGTAASANIGIAGFAYNDVVANPGGVWGIYSTVVRASGNIGNTHGMEIDVANMGTNVPLYPAAMFPAGNSNGLWIGAGGEITNVQQVGIASCAIGIIRNDSNASPTAAFDKGIVFHNKSINGTDGAAGTGIAIAFATQHQQVWFNNSNQACAEVVATNQVAANAMRLDFTQFGIIFKDRASDGACFQIQNLTNAANYITAVPTVSGGGVVQLSANGVDTNINLRLNPKGTGSLQLGYGTTVASVPANFSATNIIKILDSAGTPWYVPAKSATW